MTGEQSFITHPLWLRQVIFHFLTIIKQTVYGYRLNMDSKPAINIIAPQYVTHDPLHKLFDLVSAISVQGYDEQRRVIYWNKGSELLYGYSEQEALGKKLEDLIIPPSLHGAVIAAHNDWINHNIEIPAAEITVRHKNGQEIVVFSSHVMFINQYNNKQMYCIDIDLAAVKKAQAQVKFNEHMLEAIFEAIPDLFFLMEPDGTILDYHAGEINNLYTSSKEFIGKKMADVLPDELANKFTSHIEKVLKQDEMARFEYSLNVPNGLVYFEARINYVTEYKHIMVIIRDITEQHKSAELIRHQAYYDSLTVLPNRFLALDRLSQIMIEADSAAEQAAVLFLDLDDFKKVNDSLGHEVGDQLLIESAARLKQLLRKQDTLGRLGGDEFIILLPSIREQQYVLETAEKLLGSFRDPFKIAGKELILTVSIGVAIYPENGCSTSDLLRNADTAMYQAKALGRNTYSFFTNKMNTIIKRRLAIEDQMHGALQRNEFELYFQPQLDVSNQVIFGAEALLRWRNGVLGQVAPDEFIPIAEHTGLIVAIGKFVIQQALLFLAQWQNQQRKQFTIAINLSPVQFRDPELISFIHKALNASNVAADCLEFEITEGVLMSGHANITNCLKQMTELGIKLSMDDFGTGYSSLSYLRQYPFNILKIDRSFINSITSKQGDYNLVKAIIAMSHSLGLEVVAEGVETEQQLMLLNELGCDYAQGYYFSKPLPVAQFLDFTSNY